MKFHFRTNRRFGPVRVTLTEKGVTWGLKAGRWSWNPRTRRHTFNTPGLGSVAWEGWGPILGGLFLLVVLGALVCVVAVGWPL
jgi:hypothetical protein